MSTRTLTGFVERLREKSFTDPNPDKRAAFEEVLDLLARIDTGTAADIVAATAPKALPAFPADYPVVECEPIGHCGGCGVPVYTVEGTCGVCGR